MAQHFLVQHTQQVGREISGFSQEAIHAMCNYAWPGNVRELMNVIERAVLLCRSGRITLADLPAGFRKSQDLSLEWLATGKSDPADWSGQTLEQVKTDLITQVEKTYLEMVLKKTRGRVGEAARQAGIHPRGLYEKMKKLGIDKNQFKPGHK
jgi:DNA-binding NtrC family response regulator